jgi:hypothetical protein
VVIGLAHQVMLPLVALPLALEVAEALAAPEELGELEEVDDPEPLLQAAANATTAPTAAACASRRLVPVLCHAFIDDLPLSVLCCCGMCQNDWWSLWPPNLLR